MVAAGIPATGASRGRLLVGAKAVQTAVDFCKVPIHIKLVLIVYLQQCWR